MLFKQLFAALLFASSISVSLALPIEHLALGETPLRIKLNQFEFLYQNNKANLFKVSGDQETLRWVRYDNSILLPRIRLTISTPLPAKDLHIDYQGETLLFKQAKESASVSFFYSLYEHSPINIYHTEQSSPLESISSYMIASPSEQEIYHLTDLSCSRSNLQITGLEETFYSLGCKKMVTGKWGKEIPITKILFLSPNYTIDDNDMALIEGELSTDNPLIFTLTHKVTKEKKIISINGFVPKRHHRLNTAYGFGPYAFETTALNEDDIKERLKENAAPALMFYANLKLRPGHSLRLFNATVLKVSTFNNAGLYYANDIANLLDNKLTITTLLGFQHLYFKFNDDTSQLNHPMFPQGLEFLYMHAFGIKNYLISGGAFISPDPNIDYQNLWIRWGKKFFWEINYIHWGQDDFSARTWGVSLGFPLSQFF